MDWFCGMEGIGAARGSSVDDDYNEHRLGAIMVFQEEGLPVLKSVGSFGSCASEGITMAAFDGAGMMLKDCFRATLR